MPADVSGPAWTGLTLQGLFLASNGFEFLGAALGTEQGSQPNVGQVGWPFSREDGKMDIKEHMEVIGADGVHVGTVDKFEGGRIKLTKKDSGEGSHKGHHHFIEKGLIAGVEGDKVRLSANGDVAVTMEQER
jgi:hypothetical protein